MFLKENFILKEFKKNIDVMVSEKKLIKLILELNLFFK